MFRELNRIRRTADSIRRELATIIQQRMKDPRVGMATINQVKVSRDLSHADVYFTAMGGSNDPEVVEAALNRAGRFLRSQLALALRSRRTPRLRFHYDMTANEASRVDWIIDEDDEASDAQDYGNDRDAFGEEER